MKHHSNYYVLKLDLNELSKIRKLETIDQLTICDLSAYFSLCFLGIHKK